MKRLDSDDFCEPTGVRTRIPAVFTVVCLVRRQLFGGPARAIVTGGQLDFNTKTSAALRHGQRYRGSRAAVPSECRADGVIRMDRRRWLSAVAGEAEGARFAFVSFALFVLYTEHARWAQPRAVNWFF